MDESSNLPKCKEGEEREEQVEDSHSPIEETIKRPTENHDGDDETFDKDQRYHTRERCVPEEWWKKHILPQYDKKGQI